MNNNSKYNNGGISYYMGGGYVPGYADGQFINPMDQVNAIRQQELSEIQQNLNLPESLPEASTGIEALPMQIEYDMDDPKKAYDFKKSAYDNYLDATKNAEDEAKDDLFDFEIEQKESTFMEKLAKMGKLLDVEGASKDGTPGKGQSITGRVLLQGSGASKVPQTRRFEDGGIVSMMPMGMYQGGGVNPFLDGFEFDFDYDDYMDMINGLYGNNAEDTINREDAISRGYGSQQDDRISRGVGNSKLNYEDTPSNMLPGADISIDARDETPAAYRFYPSEVSKLYAQMKGVPFSPLIAPPKEATYIDDLDSRRMQSQLYAKDGTYVNAYADGTGRYGAQQLEPNQFPRRQELITGPGGEQGDKIPAMLSDGEFVTNSAAVRGMGIMAGANPEDEYEQRLLGARQMYDYQRQAEEMAKRYA